jgi:hypothetical protein
MHALTKQLATFDLVTLINQDKITDRQALSIQLAQYFLANAHTPKRFAQDDTDTLSGYLIDAIHGADYVSYSGHCVSPTFALLHGYIMEADLLGFETDFMCDNTPAEIDDFCTRLDAMLPKFYYDDMCAIWSAYSATSVRDLLREIYLFNAYECLQPSREHSQQMLDANIIDQQTLDALYA